MVEQDAQGGGVSASGGEHQRGESLLDGDKIMQMTAAKSLGKGGVGGQRQGGVHVGAGCEKGEQLAVVALGHGGEKFRGLRALTVLVWAGQRRWRQLQCLLDEQSFFLRGGERFAPGFFRQGKLRRRFGGQDEGSRREGGRRGIGLRGAEFREGRTNDQSRKNDSSHAVFLNAPAAGRQPASRMQRGLVSRRVDVRLRAMRRWAAGILMATSTAWAGAAEAERKPDVGFVPTPMAAVERMVEMAEIKPGDVVYDLGCGDGRIVVAAAVRHGVKAVGVDINPERVAESRERARAAGVESLVEIRQADVFRLDLDDADVVFLYLTPRLNERLMPQLRRLKPGARIVAYEFDMGAAKPVEVVLEKFDQFGEQRIYKWIVRWEESDAAGWDIFTLRP